MLGVDNFRIEDPTSGTPLDEIFPIATRARVWVARNKQHALLESHFWNLWGVVDMLDGMEHHHTNFRRIIEEISPVESLLNFHPGCDGHRAGLRHEVVAYLNRVEQFLFFTDSEFVAHRIPDVEKLIPTALKFKELRHKHAAHRSIDKPRGETPHVQTLQAWSLSSLSPIVFCPKKPRTEASTELWSLDAPPKWSEQFIGFQMRVTTAEQFVDFYLEREHSLISLEAFTVMEHLFR
jgi:hypothetical protein